MTTYWHPMKEGFIRELYLRSEPSVDIDLVPEGEQVDCSKHTLKRSVYDKLLEEFCENSDDDRMQAQLMLIMMGPQLVDDNETNDTDSVFDASDEEIETLTFIKNRFQAISDDPDLGEHYRQEVATKFREEWYKNYCDDLNDEELDKFGDLDIVSFTNHRLKVGHTERQDRFSHFMREYPKDVLDYFCPGALPAFYRRLSNGGDYDLFGWRKAEFIFSCLVPPDQLCTCAEYAPVLEENYGLEFAADYLYHDPIWEEDESGQELIFDIMKRAVAEYGREKHLRFLAYYGITEYVNDKKDIDLSIEMLSRLAAMWKQGLITDDWLTDKDGDGLAGIVDWEWGALYWEEDQYPECPNEDDYRLWLIKLLESDFANDIADYLKPLLELVLEREKNHNWENGKKAIESFLKRIGKDR